MKMKFFSAGRSSRELTAHAGYVKCEIAIFKLYARTFELTKVDRHHYTKMTDEQIADFHVESATFAIDAFRRLKDRDKKAYTALLIVFFDEIKEMRKFYSTATSHKN